MAIEERDCSVAYCSSVVLDVVIVRDDHPFCLFIFFLCSYVCLPPLFTVMCSVAAAGVVVVVVVAAIAVT